MSRIKLIRDIILYFENGGIIFFMKNLKIIDDDLNQIVNKLNNNIPSSPFEDEMPTKLLLV
ncbi:hypothetical protein [Spiroplasma endosymbiont of Dromius quadrimaculatus]|uniref:hypothetical protein n=1 Tax=Spiroplasma endosymbiont of Dromius quadrimaculatus TaxID=3066283 RepID=UPI00313CE91B